jgi:ATP-dependent DNA helicase RecG
VWLAVTPESVRKLGNILRAERDRGYDDGAVMGGMLAFLSHWQEAAREDGLPEEVIQKVLGFLSQYAELPESSRAQAIRNVVEALHEAGLIRKVDSAQPQQEAAARAQALSWNQPVTAVPGVSKVRAAQLARLGVFTVQDLIHLFPRRYEDYSALKPIGDVRYGEEVSLVATVVDVTSRIARTGRRVTTALLRDATGTIQAVWFNRKALEQRLRPGREIVVSGRVGQFLGYLTLESPEWEPLSREHLNTARIVPLYPLTEGITQRVMRRIVHDALQTFLPGVEDHLPEYLRRELALMPLQEALAAIHFPASWQELTLARERLAFDEFLMLQLGMLRRKRAAQAGHSQPLVVTDDWLERFCAALPFALTAAQKRALLEIRADLARANPMTRLLQGDVGSGKTVVALAAMLIAVANGRQAALMAPTEILAEQHYRTISALLANMPDELVRGVRVCLLTGGLTPAAKEQARQAIASGEAQIAIGTHALIQEDVEFKNLALVVVDEQHRFGVEQRALLEAKGDAPHLLVMSATPIPRSLALTLYGDLDLSIIDELPPGRQPVLTRWFGERERERIYAFVRSEVRRGGQAFVICPVIESNDDEEVRSAVEEYERLQKQVFPDLRVGLLHGRLSAQAKDEVMQAFARGELDILVCTSVVEVGIDVPRATVMVVEDAHRFGLAQLHQFRGRVGRGDRKSYCILLSDAAGELGEQRLKAIETEHDGFRLAEIDLQLRGPGQFFGVRQSGMPDLRVAKLSDLRTLERARRTAERILEQDPTLERPEHRSLIQALQRFWGSGIPAV